MLSEDVKHNHPWETWIHFISKWRRRSGYVAVESDLVLISHPDEERFSLSTVFPHICSLQAWSIVLSAQCLINSGVNNPNFLWIYHPALHRWCNLASQLKSSENISPVNVNLFCSVTQFLVYKILATKRPTSPSKYICYLPQKKENHAGVERHEGK